MAFDKAMAMMGGKKPAMGAKPPMAGSKPKGDDGRASGHESKGHVTLHDHGDGTYHSEHDDGQTVEHPHLGHALMHLANHHEPESKHMHIQHDGFSATSHGVHEDGQHEGPHDHENIEELKNHLGKFFDEEENEGSEDGGGYGGIQ